MRLTAATVKEQEFILSHAVQSAKEAMHQKDGVNEEKIKSFPYMILSVGGYYAVLRQDDDTLIGWVLLGEHVDFFTEKKVGFIYELYVLPTFRGQGLSKVLIEKSLKVLQQRGYTEVQLNVYKGNFAKEIYKKLGFSELQTLMGIQL